MNQDKRTRRNRIPYTPELRIEVKSLHAQTRWGDVAIKNQITAKQLPGHDRMTSGMISSVLYNDRLKTVDPEVLSSVLEVLRSLPSDSDQASTYDKSSTRVPIEPEFSTQLNAAFDLTRLSVGYLLKAYDAPEGLGAATLHKIRTGKQKSIRLSHRKFLLKLIASLNKS